MNTDKLIITIQEIQKWCDTNDVICFKSSTKDEPYITYRYDKESNDEWINFLQITKKLNVKIITLQNEWNLLKTIHEDKLLNIQNSDTLELLKDDITLALSHDDEIALVILSFFHNDICYEFKIPADWYHAYHRISILIDDPDDDDFDDDDLDDDDLDDDSQTEGTTQFAHTLRTNRLNNTDIEAISRRVIENDSFKMTKSRIQNRAIINRIIAEIWEEQNTDNQFDFFNIRRKTEELYEVEIKPRLELEIKNKVQELKKQGLKKVEIRAKLDISQGMVDRFYHMD
jgi:hypothetical protein